MTLKKHNADRIDQNSDSRILQTPSLAWNSRIGISKPVYREVIKKKEINKKIKIEVAKKQMMNNLSTFILNGWRVVGIDTLE